MLFDKIIKIIPDLVKLMKIIMTILRGEFSMFMADIYKIRFGICEENFTTWQDCKQRKAIEMKFHTSWIT